MKRINVAAVVVAAGNSRRPCETGVLVAGALAALLLFPASPARADAGNAHSANRSGQATAYLIGVDAAGRPVYRLPSIDVSIDRKAALALLDRKTNPAQSHAKPKPAKTHVAGCIACVPPVVR